MDCRGRNNFKHAIFRKIEKHVISLAEVRSIFLADPLLSKLPHIAIKTKIRSLFEEKEPIQLPTEVEFSEERLRRFGIEYAERDDEQDDKQDDKRDDKQDGNEEDSKLEYTPSEIPPSVATTTTRKSNLFSKDEIVEFQTLVKD